MSVKKISCPSCGANIELNESRVSVLFFEEKIIGRSRADIMMVISDALVGLEIKSDADKIPGDELNRMISYELFERDYII